MKSLRRNGCGWREETRGKGGRLTKTKDVLKSHMNTHYSLSQFETEVKDDLKECYPVWLEDAAAAASCALLNPSARLEILPYELSLKEPLESSKTTLLGCPQN